MEIKSGVYSFFKFHRGKNFPKNLPLYNHFLKLLSIYVIVVETIETAWKKYFGTGKIF